MALPQPAVATPPRSDRAFFGHPRGLSTLFFTEMWERFSYYGMRGFLLLYMTTSAALGGMGLDAATAAPIYGMYTSTVYLTNLPGGWIADRLIGQRRAVLYGGILIACGHFSLAFASTLSFYAGLVLIVLGTGLLKPNVSVIVGQIYAPKDVRRDAAFSIFYMGINLGAFLGPIITGLLAKTDRFRAMLSGWGMDPNSAWHWAFGAAGVGMTLGLIQYVWDSRHLGEAGRHPTSFGSRDADARYRRRAWLGIAAALAALGAFGAGLASGWLPFTANQVTGAYGYILLVITLGFFAFLFMMDWTPDERRRLVLITVFFVAAVLFWGVFEQAGSTLNLFADRSTDNSVFGVGFPSTWWQSLNSLFIIFLLGPFFAWLWIRLGDRQPLYPTKFALGLVLVSAGFLILVPAAQIASTGVRVSPGWLFSLYLVHTIGELCLSPVGLSSMTKLAPARIVSLMMGVWFLGASVGNFLGGLSASFYESMPLTRLLTAVAILPIVAGVAMFVFRKPLARLGGDSL